MPSVISATTTNGVAISPDNSGSLQLATNNGTTAVTIDTSQNVGIGTTSPARRLTVKGSTGIAAERDIDTDRLIATYNDINCYANATGANNYNTLTFTQSNNSGSNERMRIDSSGNVMVGKTATGGANIGAEMTQAGRINATMSGDLPLSINRKTNDGDLVRFQQDDVQEGTISVSGTTVSYNGGHLARYAQILGVKDETLLKGTVLSNLDEMNEYVDAEGNSVANEQLNKVKVSDVEGDVNVAGVFVNWSHDEAHNVDEINMAMTGDMIIRIAEGVVVQKGDLLISAGDGTAKPQGDDIVRSKTIAKVTSNHVTCTYEDGSYCVPCVLMAC